MKASKTCCARSSSALVRKGPCEKAKAPAARAERQFFVADEEAVAAAVFTTAAKTMFSNGRNYGGGYDDKMVKQHEDGSMGFSVAGQWYGQDDHFISSAIRRGLPVHVFYRVHPAEPFTYYGAATENRVEREHPRAGRPVAKDRLSLFELKVLAPVKEVVEGDSHGERAGKYIRGGLKRVDAPSLLLQDKCFQCFYHW